MFNEYFMSIHLHKNEAYICIPSTRLLVRMLLQAAQLPVHCCNRQACIDVMCHMPMSTITTILVSI